MRIGYYLKRSMPARLLQVARVVKAGIWRLVHPQAARSVPLEDQFPWSSPDVWQRLVGFYLSIPKPVIFEYGIGVSSIWHIKNLSHSGGTYVGVEHKPNWYAHVLHAIIRYAMNHGLTVIYTGEPVQNTLNRSTPVYDACLRLEGQEIAGCNVKLKLRPPRNRTQDSDGTFVEFQEYIRALNERCDVVIVDGRARKACVNYVLDTAFVKPNGLLLLFEAGRGQEGWLGSPALTETFNYQPEVQRMLKIGGELVDGCGLDRWPGLKGRRTPTSSAYSYPLEACFLRLPASG